MFLREMPKDTKTPSLVDPSEVYTQCVNTNNLRPSPHLLLRKYNEDSQYFPRHLVHCPTTVAYAPSMTMDFSIVPFLKPDQHRN